MNEFPTITRRAVLGGLTAALGQSLAPMRAHAAISCPNACRSMIGPDDRWIKGLPIIDAHCHIFNARDIPAAHFITKVALPHHAIYLNDRQRVVLEREIESLMGGMLTDTPGYAQEHAALQARLAGEPPQGSLARAPGLPRFASGSETSCYGKDVAHNISAVRNFVSLLTGFRYRNFEALSEAYRSDIEGVGVALFTPAMVDMDFWLDAARDPSAGVGDIGDDVTALTQTSPAQQVELMEMIQRLNPGRCHGFVSYCPWRQVDDLHHNENVTHDPARRRVTALEVVEDAILNRGFVGVKLYPPMGFRPFGNVEIPLEGFPSHAARMPYAARFGERLDQALLALYRFCMRHDVPVMTHCAPTNGVGEDGDGISHAERADPKYWRRVLDSAGLSGLRLNLAHFGAAGVDEEVGGVDGAWRKTIGTLMDTHAHVYADMAYFPHILADNFTGSGQHCREAAEILEPIRKQFLARPAGDVRVRRLLYGSDWSMLSKEFYYADYLAVFAHMYRRKIYGVGRGAERNARAFLAGNAVRFLGLRKGEKARARLEAWYSRHGLDTRMLARFDAVEV